MRRWLVLLSLGSVLACGPEAAVWVRIEAPLQIPGECDAVRVTALRLNDEGVAYSRTHELTKGGLQFPLELALLADESAPFESGLRIEVEALLGGVRAAPWSAAAESLVMRPARVTPLVIRLCDCAP